MNVARGDVAERHENKSALMITGMGDRQAHGTDAPLVVRQEIKVQRARSPFYAPLAPERSLDTAKKRQKILRREAARQRQHAVQVRALTFGTAHGRGLVQRGDGPETDAGGGRQRPDRAFERSPAETEVGPEGDVGGMNGRVLSHVFRRRIITRSGPSVVSTVNVRASVGK